MGRAQLLTGSGATHSGVVVWGFAPVGISANAARDLGGRFAALTLFGSEANGGNYAAIAALTNIPAILFAGVVHDFVFTDSSRCKCALTRSALLVANPYAWWQR